MDPMPRAPRRLWGYLAVAAGAAVVVLSWAAPEPPPPTQPFEQVSYSNCLPDSAPIYGTRSISYNCAN